MGARKGIPSSSIGHVWLAIRWHLPADGTCCGPRVRMQARRDRDPEASYTVRQAMNQDSSSGERPPVIRVLALCTGNSCRSQMVEAWFHRLAEGRVEAFSAGVRPTGHVHPMAIRAMAQVGIDIGGARSKSVEEFLGQPFDYVITVCAPAAEACPVFPGRAARLHWPLDDPADVQGDGAAWLQAFSHLRDEVEARVRSFLHEIEQPDEQGRG